MSLRFTIYFTICETHALSIWRSSNSPTKSLSIPHPQGLYDKKHTFWSQNIIFNCVFKQNQISHFEWKLYKDF